MLNLDRTGGTPISDAVNEYLQNGNRYVYFKEGLYYVDKQINLPSDTLIECDPNAIFYDPNYRTTNKHRFFYSKNTRNVHIKGGYIVGNNRSFAYETDGFIELEDGFDQGCGIFFQNVNFGSIQSLKTCYLNESIVVKWCLDVKVTNIRIDQGNEGQTQTGITLAGSENSHVSNVRVMNGGDGALYIYNGTNCSIKDAVLINTGNHNNANCGMESCNFCTLENIEVVGGAYGFTIVESVRNGSVIDCKAVECNVGFMVSPFLLGSSGEDIKMIGCSVIKAKNHSNITLPCCGYLIEYWGTNTNRLSDAIMISNCYFGKSEVGKALVIRANSSIDLSKVIISNNIFEAQMYSVTDSKTYNTRESLIEIENCNGAIISNNVFTFQGTSNSSSYQISVKNSKFIKLLNNTLILNADNNQINVGTGCSNITIAGNTFKKCPTGYSAITLNGSTNYVKDNEFLGAGNKISMSAGTKNNYILNNIAPDSTSSSFSNGGSGTIKKGNYNNNGIEL